LHDLVADELAAQNVHIVEIREELGEKPRAVGGDKDVAQVAAKVELEMPKRDAEMI
jgi:hypothetical protein